MTRHQLEQTVDRQHREIVLLEKQLLSAALRAHKLQQRLEETNCRECPLTQIAALMPDLMEQGLAEYMKRLRGET